jgi:hypothetical protein
MAPAIAKTIPGPSPHRNRHSERSEESLFPLKDSGTWKIHSGKLPRKMSIPEASSPAHWKAISLRRKGGEILVEILLKDRLL